MNKLYEVFAAAKRGDNVVHRNFGGAYYDHLSRFLRWNINQHRVTFGELELDPDCWTIEEKCPHEEGSIKWAFWHGSRGRKLTHNMHSPTVYEVIGGEMCINESHDMPRGKRCILTDRFLTGWRLA